MYVHFSVIYNMHDGYMFVCKKCGTLNFSCYDIWNKQDYHGESTESLERNKIIRLHQKVKQDTNNFKDFINDANCPFPLCPMCCQTVIRMMKGKKNFYENAAMFYSRLNIPCKSIFGECLSEEIEKHQKEISQLKVITTEFTDEKIDVIRNSPPKERGKSADDSTVKRTARKSLRRRVTSSLVNSLLSNIQIESFSSLISPIVFRIYVHKHYGTINGKKLGTQTPKIINNDEIEIAFVFLAQLLHFLGKLCGIETSQVFVTTYVTIKSGDKLLSLAEFDFTKRKETAEFNEALDIFIQTSNKIFTTFLELENISIPFPIDLKKHAIIYKQKKVNYLYQAKSPQTWTFAMKLLLRNYKEIQIYAMKKFVNGFKC